VFKIEKVSIAFCRLSSLLNIALIIRPRYYKQKYIRPRLGSLADGTMRKYQEAVERGKLPGFTPEDFDFSYLGEE